MILATRLARKRSASTRMRAHSRGLMLTRRSKSHASGLQTAFEEKTDFSLLTDLTRAVPHRESLDLRLLRIAPRRECARRHQAAPREQQPHFQGRPRPEQVVVRRHESDRHTTRPENMQAVCCLFSRGHFAVYESFPTLTCSWPMADVVARGGIGRLRVPRGASGTRYVSMRGLIGSRRVPST